MQYFILMVLAVLSLTILAVIIRELYHIKPGLALELRRFEELIGLEILILTSIALVIKFV